MSGHFGPLSQKTESTVIKTVLDGLVAQGKAPDVQLDRVRDSIQPIDDQFAVMVALMGTDDFRNLNFAARENIWESVRRGYVMWRLARDDDFWNELKRLV